MPRILLVDPIPLPLVERMRPMFPAGTGLDMVSTLSEEDLARHAAETEILLVIQRKVDARLLSILPHVRFVQRVGVGYDNLDLEALQAAGVVAAYTPGANAVAVAEHTILLMLALLKRFAAAESATRQGAGLQWSCSKPDWAILPVQQLALSALAASDAPWPSDWRLSGRVCSTRLPMPWIQQPNSNLEFAMPRSRICWLLPRSLVCTSH